MPDRGWPTADELGGAGVQCCPSSRTNVMVDGGVDEGMREGDQQLSRGGSLLQEVGVDRAF
jgi:hypothetical protein